MVSQIYPSESFNLIELMPLIPTRVFRLAFLSSIDIVFTKFYDKPDDFDFKTDVSAAIASQPG